MVRILIADDEKNIREGLKRALTPHGYEILLAGDGKEALYLFETERVDLMIADISMPKLSGLEMFAELRKHERKIPVIFITGHGSVETAVEAMRMGAYDFLTKPISLEKLELIITRALNLTRIEETNRALTLQVRTEDIADLLVGKSRVMERLRETVRLLAGAQGSIHIYGESGTGKERICNALHQLSDSTQPLIKVNCAALSESVLESELFGHEKGAFTGADALKIGRFEAANGGMIFLDEISEISPHLQVKLLRVLQEKQIERVGSHQPVDVQMRVISASNKHLSDEVKAGRFREDLFYRLNVLDITAPPLRERGQDITLLAGHFFQHYLKLYNKGDLRLTPQIFSVFQQYTWPGNVRELMNVIEKMVVLHQGDKFFTVDDIPESIRLSPQKSSEDASILSLALGTETLAEIETKVIAETIRFCRGNKSKAASILGIGRKTLYRKSTL